MEKQNIILDRWIDEKGNDLLDKVKELEEVSKDPELKLKDLQKA